MNPKPTLIPGLRSPYEQAGGIVHFPRMLDKIRLHRNGALPPAWVSALGAARGLDGHCCRLLGIEYSALQVETLKGGADEALLAWALAHGRKPSEAEIEVWNAFLSKLGWRDTYTERLHFRLREIGQPLGTVLTMFDFIDFDEGRSVRFADAPSA